VSKSPLTGRINDSLASSGFAIAGKRCGCDAIVIVGRAAELSVLLIDGSDLEDEPVAKGDTAGPIFARTRHGILGRNVSRDGSRVESSPRGDYRIASIGPAGEHRRYATISHDGRHAGRAAAGLCWAPKISRRSPYAERSLPSGRIRAS